MRRATTVVNHFIFPSLISIHALREESDFRYAGDIIGDNISIHALREESDPFLEFRCAAELISIHALREESDTLRRLTRWSFANFNPRSP